MATRASVVEGLFLASQRKIDLSGATFFVYILPPLVCEYLMGVLVQFKGTRYYRFALLPVLVWLTWRSTFVDATGGDPRQGRANMVLITHMCTISMRATVWAFSKEPFRRLSPSRKRDETGSESIYAALWNAWDLMLNLRGIGWNWSQRLVLPRPASETGSRTVFVLLSAVQLAVHALGFDACLQAIRILSPETFGSASGGSLFDHTLPTVLELLRAVFVSMLAIWLTYFTMQWTYLSLAIVWVILFHQHPSQWPPLFDAPWLSTSLSELWGRRWHQMLRQQLVGLGVWPFGYLFGHYVGLFAAFLISGIFHVIDLRSFGGGGNLAPIIGFWVMNGVGVVLERVWKDVTGRRVDGGWGRMWTFGWLALWGTPVVNEWAKAGRFGSLSLPGRFEPSLALVGFVRECWMVIMR